MLKKINGTWNSNFFQKLGKANLTLQNNGCIVISEHESPGAVSVYRDDGAAMPKGRVWKGSDALSVLEINLEMNRKRGLGQCLADPVFRLDSRDGSGTWVFFPLHRFFTVFRRPSKVSCGEILMSPANLLFGKAAKSPRIPLSQEKTCLRRQNHFFSDFLHFLL